MTLVNKNYFLLALTLSLLVVGESTNIQNTVGPIKLIGRKTRVEIVNQLPNGASFTIHCKSKDDDLGEHVVASGQSYGFGFRTNFWGTTLFFCGVSWQGGSKTFDIYDAGRDEEDRCNNVCRWGAKGDSIIGFNERSPTTPDIVIPWK